MTKGKQELPKKKILPFNSIANMSIRGQHYSRFLRIIFPLCTDFLKTDMGCNITKKIKDDCYRPIGVN